MANTLSQVIQHTFKARMGYRLQLSNNWPTCWRVAGPWRGRFSPVLRHSSSLSFASLGAKKLQADGEPVLRVCNASA